MSHRKYHYVGSKEIKIAAESQPAGTSIRSLEDLENWVLDEATERRQDGLWVATFTISTELVLCIAPRRSEHVACAGGKPVLSAGEIVIDGELEVTDISNQSTGYCPEPESWKAVEATLDKLPMKHPGKFTMPVVFRLCTNCKERNIVKDSWFYCAVCEKDLPLHWNFDDPDERPI